MQQIIGDNWCSHPTQLSYSSTKACDWPRAASTLEGMAQNKPIWMHQKTNSIASFSNKKTTKK